MQLLMLEYDGDFAWLGNGSTPQIVIRDRQLSIQGNHSPYSHWADYLDQIAKEIGLPYNIIDMPSF